MLTTCLKNSLEKASGVIIYGTGDTAAQLCEDLCDYRIIGVMDSYKCSGSFKGYSIISWEEIELESHLIMIVATISRYHREIYFAIREKCLFYGIEIFDPLCQENIRNPRPFGTILPCYSSRYDEEL